MAAETYELKRTAEKEESMDSEDTNKEKANGTSQDVDANKVEGSTRTRSPDNKSKDDAPVSTESPASDPEYREYYLECGGVVTRSRSALYQRILKRKKVVIIVLSVILAAAYFVYFGFSMRSSFGDEGSYRLLFGTLFVVLAMFKIHFGHRIGKHMSYLKKKALKYPRVIKGLRWLQWGTCNSDERYPERLGNTYFIPFPKQKTRLETCLRWIRACGRPHQQLNVNNINKHKFVCSKHFVHASGPTAEFPDPVPADGSDTTPTRPPPRKRLCLETVSNRVLLTVTDTSIKENEIPPRQAHQSTGTQTDDKWVSPLELLSQTVTIQALQTQIHKQKQTLKLMEEQLRSKEKEIQELKEKVKTFQKFGLASVLERSGKLKDLFKYYTGITYVRFLALLTFLLPSGESSSLHYEKGRRDIKSLSIEDCLFLILCRLRQGFGLKDIAMRFGLSLQSSGVIFNTWVEHMYLKLGQLCIWPDRDVILQNMPKDFRTEYPTTMIIIDGTELRTDAPCALGLQSQLYSDYKSSTTLKCLVGCDPSGSLTFVSELFTGSISDKALTEQSGFYDTLKDLLKIGYIQEGDAVMADKGFTIENELKDLGLQLNIPPFASSTEQMSPADTLQNQKIAAHRVHIERLIAKIKKFKIVSYKIPTTLFQRINEIWTICSYLTLFQDVFVTDKIKV